MPIIDLKGRRFGRLAVIEHQGFSKSRQAEWLCRCDCGKQKVINGSLLRRGDIVSCGCYLQERKTKHGLVGSAQYRLWESAKTRSKKLNLEFTIIPADIMIPSHCPALGIPLKSSLRACCDNSPSLDRIDPSKGYTKDNIQVISHRANSIKRDATPEELEMVIRYIRATIGLGASHEKVASCGLSGIPGV